MKKVVNVKVEKEEWSKYQDKAFNKLNKEAKIDGFRPGKAPREKFEQKYGKQEIIMEAADMAIQTKYEEVMTEDKILPIIQPKVEIKKADEESLEVDFVIITDPEVTLGEYKNLGIKQKEAKATKEEVKEKLDQLLNDYAELVAKEGKVAKGDIAIIDFEGFKDGVAFEGGKAENYSLSIGSNSFIPGFEDGLVGMAKDEEKDLELTFPEDYMSEELKGQKVVFKVKVHEIKERKVPKLDKDFFEDLNIEGIDSKEKLEEMLKEEIIHTKSHQLENEYIDKVLEKAISNMKIEIEEELIEDEQEHMYSELVERLAMQGVSEELYFEYTKTTKEDVISKMKDEAEKRIKVRYLLREVVKAEKLKVTDKEAKDEVKEMAKMYNVTEEEIMKEIQDLEYIKGDLLIKKAINVIKN